MTLSVILRERSDALHTALSFRTQYPVILNEVKNLVDTSLTLSMT